MSRSHRVPAPPTGRASLAMVALLGLAACSDNEEEAAAPAAAVASEKCPNVHLDKLATRWIKVDGSTADHTHRFEIVDKGGTYEMWYTGGFFTKKRMAAERRSSDVKFTEVPTGKKKEQFEAGIDSIDRLYVEPRIEKCALRVSVMTVKMKDGKESEVPKPGFVEYLPFPEGQELTFRPCDGPLFLGKAASDKAVADKQLEELGVPDAAHGLGEKIPVGVYTDAAADGDASCSYTMALYFDDAPVDGKKDVPAGQVADGLRHWYVPEWYAPYSGNHHFEMYRYKTCADAKELIGVSCVEAALH